MKTLTLLRHRSVRSIAHLGLVASLLFGATSASAQPPMQAPTKELQSVEASQLQALKVSKVQPVVFADATQDAHISAAMSRAASLASADQLASGAKITPAQLQSATATEGFGFAGSSTEIDVVSLKFGYLLGMLPALNATNPEAFKAQVGQLDQLAALSDVFVPGVGAQVKAFITSAQSGKIDHVAYLGMMREAAQGIADSSKDPEAERRHGYLLLGLWSGLAQMSAIAGEVPVQVAQTGELLVSMLEKDATYGGSDLQLASLLRDVNKELRSVQPSAQVVQEKIAKMLTVTQDA